MERALSKHKQFHSTLRASLESEKLDDQLFVRYNFETIMGVSSAQCASDCIVFDSADFYTESFEIEIE